MSKSIYVAATSQNDGKTTLSIGLIDAFQKRYDKLGFIKPVGQQYLTINDQRIDKDTYLIESICNFGGDLKLMSPIAIPRGFTEDYLENREIKKPQLISKLIESYDMVKDGKDLVIIEGTGHAGVGAVFDLSNAKVAKILHSKVIIVCRGGIGRPLDEVFLNKTLFEQEGVEIVGVVMNQVSEEKYEKIRHTAKLALGNMGLKLLGVIPARKRLSDLTMFQIKEQLGADLINGDYLHGRISNIIVGAMNIHHAFDYFKSGSLLITPGDRSDLIIASLFGVEGSEGKPKGVSGIILTGGYMPKPNIFRLIKQTNIPVIFVNKETYETASIVHDILVKISPDDPKKIALAREIVSEFVDVDYIDSQI
jgi:BioD-like phosphotransacetylase family protein